MSLVPPFVFDWDGDLRVSQSLLALVASFELQDLEDLANKTAYDSEGRVVLLSVESTPATPYTRRWDFRYPVKAFETAEQHPEKLRGLLLSYLACMDEGERSHFAGSSLSELIQLAEERKKSLEERSGLKGLIARVKRLWSQPTRSEK